MVESCWLWATDVILQLGRTWGVSVPGDPDMFWVSVHGCCLGVTLCTLVTQQGQDGTSSPAPASPGPVLVLLRMVTPVGGELGSGVTDPWTRPRGHSPALFGSHEAADSAGQREPGHLHEQAQVPAAVRGGEHRQTQGQTQVLHGSTGPAQTAGAGGGAAMWGRGQQQTPGVGAGPRKEGGASRRRQRRGSGPPRRGAHRCEDVTVCR